MATFLKTGISKNCLATYRHGQRLGKQCITFYSHFGDFWGAGAFAQHRADLVASTHGY